jgi:hypothetical protein
VCAPPPGAWRLRGELPTPSKSRSQSLSALSIPYLTCAIFSDNSVTPRPGSWREGGSLSKRGGRSSTTSLPPPPSSSSSPSTHALDCRRPPCPPQTHRSPRVDSTAQKERTAPPFPGPPWCLRPPRPAKTCRPLLLPLLPRQCPSL